MMHRMAQRAGRPGFSDEANEELRRLLERTVNEKFKGSKTAASRMLGISQPAVSQRMKSGGFSYTTAIRLLQLADVSEPDAALTRLESGEKLEEATAQAPRPARVIEAENRVHNLMGAIRERGIQWSQSTIDALEQHAFALPAGGHLTKEQWLHLGDSTERGGTRVRQAAEYDEDPFAAAKKPKKR